MAKPSPTRLARRSLLQLVAIIVILAAALAGGVIFAKATVLPKLGLDLAGGTEVILAPQLQGNQRITSDELDQAVAIIRQRIDASGVSEAQISTQGSDNIVISIAGSPSQAQLDRIEASAKMDLRPVLATAAGASSSVGSTASPTASATPAPTPSASLRATPTAAPTNGSDLAYLTPALQARYEAFSCKKDAAEVSSAAPADQPLIACDTQADEKYVLGPVEVQGSDITNATAGMGQGSGGVSNGQYVVNLSFDGRGTKDFAAVSERLVNLQPPRNQFAFVVDGKVLSAPTMNAVITAGNAQISGSFTQQSAQTLADQLKFGSLPVSFRVQSSDTISATLGSSQLQAGLVAGLIGLLLVVIYTLFQYRLLGLVTITSLVVAALLTFLIIALLSWRIDYRLSLAGVAGLIVAIGFTADSFIVYFERIRDELREGRSLTSAVEAGWKRAKRTIYASKATNLLAAIVLYVLAVGNVQGFAFTLGVTTVIDVLVVILFTHPTLQLLARTRFFSSGRPASGLDPEALGALYRGAARFRTAESVTPSRARASAGEAARRQTIAERKAAERADGELVGASRSGGRRPEGDEGKDD